MQKGGNSERIEDNLLKWHLFLNRELLKKQKDAVMTEDFIEGE